MAWRLFDYECTGCGHVFEELVQGDETPPCPECGDLVTDRLISAPNLATMSLLSKEDYKKSMMKRSADHTKKLVAKEGVNGQAAVNLTRKSGRA